MTQGEREEKLPTQAELEASKPEDVESLKKALEEEKAKAERYLANWQRAQADYINYKRYREQENEEMRRLANADLVISLLPALDDLERAFAAIPPELAELPWVKGISLVERKLWQALQAQGLSPIEAEGKPFDPREHEGVAQTKGKEGIVIQEIQKGYKLNDRVLRPAKVIVGNGEDEAKEE